MLESSHADCLLGLVYADMSPICFFLLLSYMYNPSNDQEPRLVSSLEACEDHQVKWEASVAGKVVLAPDGGSLPVEGVEVSWALMNHDKTEVLKDGLAGPNDDSGVFEIEINELWDLGNNLRYPLELSFAKQADYNSKYVELDEAECPSGTELDQAECETAGLDLGYTLRDGIVLVYSWVGFLVGVLLMSMVKLNLTMVLRAATNQLSIR